MKEVYVVKNKKGLYIPTSKLGAVHLIATTKWSLITISNNIDECNPTTINLVVNYAWDDPEVRERCVEELKEYRNFVQNLTGLDIGVAV